MVEDTDKTVKQVILENPGIPLEQEIYAYCNNKIPVHTGAKDLKHKPRKQFNSIAIKTYNHDYMCIDFDGYSAADDEITQKQEKQAIASIIKDNFIPLLDEQTKKYRIDKTASNKFHVLEGFYQTQQFTKGDYPEYEPKLIVEGGEYYQSSVVGYKYHTRSFHPYYTSYEECAKYLTAYIKRTGKDHLFMPMCYLYRNAIELGLKRIIIEDSSTIDTEKALKICKKKKHSILGLYNSIKPELDAHDNGTDTTLQDVYKYINSFHDIDTTSDKFRYPCDNDLNVHFKDSTKLDIDNVASCFEELITFLDGASHMLSVEKEIAAEAAAEAASWSI